jgi:D-xylose transport system ATP-binding protein
MTTTTTEAGRSSAADSEALLELRGIDKSFGAVQVLHDVSLTVRLGRVTALVGDNGAGKSTLIKGIAGIHPFDRGDYIFEGKKVHVTNPKQANALGVEVVYQDLALCDNLDIVENLYLGRETLSGGFLDEIAMEQRAAETLAGLSVRTVTSIRQKVASLSGGQRQTVAIARAVLWNSKLVILDEPTAALGVAQTEQVLNLVRRLADRGLAVVLISHNMNDVLQVADDIAVLYLGRMTAQVEANEVSHSDVVKLITGGSLVEDGGHVAVTDAHDLNGDDADDGPGASPSGAQA